MKQKETSIQRKIMRAILLPCLVVSVLMATVYMIFDFITFRQAIKNNLITQGLVIAANSTAPLAFDSPFDANETLRSLRADRHLVAACLYDNQGHLFAKYPEGISDSQLPEKPEKSGYRRDGKFLVGFQPVVEKGKVLGTLYLKASLGPLYRQLQRDAFIAVILISASLLIAYLLSTFLQKTISKPILSLRKTAEKISGKADYSVRAVKMSNDELGSLTDTFNEMLARIEVQNSELLNAREESLKLAAIVESSGDIIIGQKFDGTITSWNDSARRILEYTPEEVIGESVSKILLPDRLQEEHKITAALKKGGHIDSQEAQFVTKSKKVIDVSLTISPVRDNVGNIVGISKIARDITDQKLNEKRVFQSEEQLRLATQAAEMGTFDLDINSNIIFADARGRELLSIGDKVTKFGRQFLNAVHLDDRKRVIEAIKTACNKNLGKGNVDIEYRVTGKDDKLRWIRAKGKVFFNEKDQPTRLIGTVLNVTRKKLEEQRKNDFIAIISHELKTPLTSIRSYVQLLLAKTKKEDGFTRQALKRAEIQTRKMASMIKDFLSLARIEEGKLKLAKEKFPVRKILEEVVAEAAFLTPRHPITLAGCPEGEVFVDKDKIGQVLINLISNAIKYSPPESIITIGCENSVGRVKIYVRDQGIGISSEDQKNLFSRFYRVENPKVRTVSGFGIGLYIVSEILRLHNSAIEVESQENMGSTFSFTLETVS